MFVRPKLKYDFSDLEPFIDTETMYEHYEKHYKTYTDKFNKELLSRNIKSKNLVQILRNYKNIKAIRDNGGGFYNHLLYFENISPFQEYYHIVASPKMRHLIERNFKTYDNFLTIFTEEALKVFGSGWVWLIEKNGILKIVTTKNQENPIMFLNWKILLGMDVWEHAYYLKHKSNRAGYIKDFFEVLDWGVVSQRLES